MSRRMPARVGLRLVREPFGFIGLVLVASALFVLTLQWPDLTTLLALPLLVGGLVLTLPSLVQLVTVTGLMLIALGGMHGVDAGFVAAAAIVAVTAVVWLGTARSRARLGVRGSVGEATLVDLRDRLLAQGELPALPRGWEAEIVRRSAGGATFSGDFLVATRSSRMILEVALVDVSGKGLAAGTRALLLSGAFGGLLGSLPPSEFLPAANAYLLRQEWVARGFRHGARRLINAVAESDLDDRALVMIWRR